MPAITLILPTRERVQLVRRALDSVVATADEPQRLEIVLYVDVDDEPSHAIERTDLTIVKLIRPRTKMGAITQACYEASAGRYIMLLNDDVVCRTPGWDSAVLEQFGRYPDDVALVWGNDLFRAESLPSHPILSRTVCEIMGGVCPEEFDRDYIDTHIYDVFRILRHLGHDRMGYLPEVIFEHLHFEAAKAVFDSTYVKRRQTDDELTYIAWAEERRLAAEALARHIESEIVEAVPQSAR